MNTQKQKENWKIYKRQKRKNGNKVCKAKG